MARLRLARSWTLSHRWRHERLSILEKAATAILREPTGILTDTKGHHILRLDRRFEDYDESEEEAVLLVGKFRRMKISACRSEWGMGPVVARYVGCWLAVVAQAAVAVEECASVSVVAWSWKQCWASPAMTRCTTGPVMAQPLGRWVVVVARGVRVAPRWAYGLCVSWPVGRASAGMTGLAARPVVARGMARRAVVVTGIVAARMTSERASGCSVAPSRDGAVDGLGIGGP